MMLHDPPLLRTLMDPRAYPHAVERVERIETHISWVFLAGERVYKVKKPVDLGFLDFTTLERRRHFCEEEVRLNRRLTDDVYLGVVDLYEAPRPFEASGPPREAAVVMRRLPHDRMLDVLVREGRAAPALLEAIGARVAAFHAEAPTGGEIDELGGLATIRANWDENFVQTADLGPDVLPEATRRTLRAWVAAVMDREAARFASRVAAGRSRDCHGDLQAQHVCCTEPLEIFDCIEFNHRFRYGDTASEIAFLAMDLDRLGRPDLATRFLNAYLQDSGDYDAVPLLDFYRAYRAFVRGKVLGFLSATRPEAAAKARERFRLAVRYAEARRTPRLVITTGVVGSGKTTVAKEVAAALGAVLVRTDVVRKRLAGLPPTVRASAAFGEGLYTEAMTRRTYEAALAIADTLLRAGWPVVVDGAFSSSARRAPAAALAEAAKSGFDVLWCDAPDAVLAERLARRARDPREASDADASLLRRHRAQYEPPTGAAVVRIDTTAPNATTEATRRLSLTSPGEP